MNSSKLPPIIDISSLNSQPEIITCLYDFFKKTYIGPQNRKLLLGKHINFNFSNFYEEKFEFFWHLISLSESEEFNILPCNNDLSFLKCPDQNCLSQKNKILLKKRNRNICVYRGIRLHWVGAILELANKDDSSIKQWEEGKFNYIRYQHETADYIVVLLHDKGYYKFVSAYPVFYINKKKNYDRQYEQYQTINQSATAIE